MSDRISEAIVRRLPIYYRHLKELELEGKTQISSHELGKRLGFTASQIRQDINAINGNGIQGTGYPVKKLRTHIGSMLGLDQLHSMVIIGMGNIGHAIALSDSFPSLNFQITALFDNDPAKIGSRVGNFEVRSMDGVRPFLEESPAEIAVIALPRASAQKTTEFLISCGIKAFWNFAPVDLSVPDDVSVVNVHMDESLELLGYRLTCKNNATEGNV